MPTHKRVTIPTTGPIYPKGGVMGPILSKHMEPIETIEQLLQGAYPVVEHLNNGKQVTLTLANFREDFNAAKPEVKVEKPEAPKAPEKVAEEEKKEVVEDEQKEQAPQHSYKDKKNKNRSNNNRVEDPIQKK